MVEILKADREILKVACQVIEQNSRILCINEELIKLLSAPRLCEAGKENE